MQVLNTILSSRPDYLVALQSAPKMPLPPPPPAPLLITPVVQQVLPSAQKSKQGLSLLQVLLIAGTIGFVGAYIYQKIDEARERKRQMK